jgi:sigma-B regulation protein RsbU (phosphoserine phosphatase)
MTGFATRFAATQALLEKNRILSRIDREIALAQKLVDDPVLVRWAKAEEDPAVKALAMQELQSYRRVFAAHSYFLALDGSRHYYIFNSDPDVERLQVTTLSPKIPADAWYFEALRSVDSFALNVEYDRTIQAARVWINAIIRDSAGAKIGIGGTGIDISDFIREVLKPEEKDVTTILVDRLGIIQAHPSIAYVQRNASANNDAEKVRIYDLMPSAAEAQRLRGAIGRLATGASQVESLPIATGGRRYLAAVTYMAHIDWFNIVLVDSTNVVGLREFLPLAATIAASLILVILAIAFTLSRAVLRPLSALASASREISQGRYGVRLEVTRRDEIGQLTRSFNEMSATVHEATTGLETRVRERTRELTEANRALEDSQRLISESLSYARRLQAGILPAASVLARDLPEHFVYSLPRDVVGGDFYSYRARADGFVAAVIDCTGHGVPGAFMTMSAHAVLTHVLDASDGDDPSRIIAELDRTLRETMHANDGAERLDAGLDIALCVCRPGRGTAMFAGAGLPLCVWDGGRVTRIPGDRRRVGYRGARTELPWTSHSLRFTPETCFYLVTDGILDQAGGEKGFGLGEERLAAVIGQCGSLPMRDQEPVFRRAIADWQGARAQRDDCTVFGFKPGRAQGA